MESERKSQSLIRQVCTSDQELPDKRRVSVPLKSQSLIRQVCTSDSRAGSDSIRSFSIGRNPLFVRSALLIWSLPARQHFAKQSQSLIRQVCTSDLLSPAIKEAGGGWSRNPLFVRSALLMDL